MFDRQNPEKKDSIIPRLINPFLSFHTQNQTGTTLVTGVAIGLIALGGATLAIAKAGQNKTNTIADEQTKQILAVAEAGIAKTLGNFNKADYRLLMLGKYSKGGNWQLPSELQDSLTDLGNDAPKVVVANPCGTTGLTDGQKVESLEGFLQTNLTNNGESFNANTKFDLATGSYELESYLFNGNINVDNGKVTGGNGTGTIRMKGQKEETQNTAIYEAVFNVEVNPPSTPSGGGAAALLGNFIRIGALDAYANTVICTDASKCVIPSGTCQAGQTNIDEITATNYGGLTSALGMNSGGTLFGTSGTNANLSNVVIGVTSIPPVPTAPSNINSNDIIEVRHDTTRTGITVGSGNDTNRNYVLNLHQLPSVTQTVSPGVTGKVWYITINNWSGNGKIIIQHQDSVGGTSALGPNDQVRFYRTGDLNVTGSGGIILSDGVPTVTGNNNITFTVHNPSSPPASGVVTTQEKSKAIRLIGGSPTTGVSTTPQTWTFGGTACVTAHIHAPNATVGISNGNGCSLINLNTVSGTSNFGSTNPNLFGSIWANEILGDLGNHGTKRVFYENTFLTQALLTEFGGHNVTGDTSSLSVKMDTNSRFELVRQPL